MHVESCITDMDVETLIIDVDVEILITDVDLDSYHKRGCGDSDRRGRRFFHICGRRDFYHRRVC